MIKSKSPLFLSCIFIPLIYQLKYLWFIAFVWQLSVTFAQDGGNKKSHHHRRNPIIKTRLSVSPVLSLYKSNPHHTSGIKPKMAFNISWKEEIRLDKHNSNYLMIGVEYMFHGVNFNSYYFYNDSLQLYTIDRLKYKYSLTINELDFPIQIKHSFQNETNAVYTGYVYAGYCYRWLLESHLKVEDNGRDIVSQQERITFKTPTFNPVNSSFLNIGVGVQKNSMSKHNAIFAEAQFRYGLSPFYLNESFTASSLYTTSHFIMLTVGTKF